VNTLSAPIEEQFCQAKSAAIRKNDFLNTSLVRGTPLLMTTLNLDCSKDAMQVNFVVNVVRVCRVITTNVSNSKKGCPGFGQSVRPRRPYNSNQHPRDAGMVTRLWAQFASFGKNITNFRQLDTAPTIARFLQRAGGLKRTNRECQAPVFCFIQVNNRI
jgi:hypothetical protein